MLLFALCFFGLYFTLIIIHIMVLLFNITKKLSTATLALLALFSSGCAVLLANCWLLLMSEDGRENGWEWFGVWHRINVAFSGDQRQAHHNSFIKPAQRRHNKKGTSHFLDIEWKEGKRRVMIIFQFNWLLETKDTSFVVSKARYIIISPGWRGPFTLNCLYQWTIQTTHYSQKKQRNDFKIWRRIFFSPEGSYQKKKNQSRKINRLTISIFNFM